MPWRDHLGKSLEWTGRVLQTSCLPLLVKGNFPHRSGSSRPGVTGAKIGAANWSSPGTCIFARASSSESSDGVRASVRIDPSCVTAASTVFGYMEVRQGQKVSRNIRSTMIQHLSDGEIKKCSLLRETDASSILKIRYDLAKNIMGHLYNQWSHGRGRAPGGLLHTTFHVSYNAQVDTVWYTKH
ncbi:hypothetical protein RRG08_061250 [Elysia crispata]|uniref:Uncharacterized protein n=1 Tax=Elysia crispata TaxID=231223 RepID=A0AAE0ZHD1_9GAST|nr:hypothetical protein RRG08_061250 [Elysia crispata]